ncbi:hypothetical protein AB4144_60095, partial [Rhizobiaceae sp. 2RAB30]
DMAQLADLVGDDVLRQVSATPRSFNDHLRHVIGRYGLELLFRHDVMLPIIMRSGRPATISIAMKLFRRRWRGGERITVACRTSGKCSRLRSYGSTALGRTRSGFGV